jgi:hypothetical protein
MDLLHNTQNSPNKIKPSAAEVGSAILEFNKTEILHSKAITDNGQNTGLQHYALSGNHNIQLVLYDAVNHNKVSVCLLN